MFIASFSFVIIAWAEIKISDGETVGISYQIWAYLFLTAAEVLISITALEFSYSQAPNPMKSFIMSLYLLSVALGNVFIVIVNRVIIEEVIIEKIESSNSSTFVYVNDISKYQLGEKFNINQEVGLEFYNMKDTVQLKGTFLVGDVNTGRSQFTLWDINREDVISFGRFESNKDNEFTIYKLKGANYFYFFAILMAVVGCLFIFVSENYKGKTYIQEETTRE